MKQRVITVTKVGGNGMVVTFDGSGEECLQAVGVVLASAVANMARGGTTAAVINQQIAACVDYGMRHGLERARDGSDRWELT